MSFESNYRNRVKGARARSEGLGFETFIVNQFRRDGIRVIHLPQGGKFVRGKFGKAVMRPSKMPFDMILSRPGKSAYLDSKSISDENIVYSFLTPHQVDILSDLESDGHKAGYLVHFKKTNNVVFFSARILQSLRQRESLKPEDGEQLGNVYQLSLKGFF